MADAGDERLQQAHQRQNEELAWRLEASETARAPEPAPVAPPLPGVEPAEGHDDSGPNHGEPFAHPTILPDPAGGPAAAWPAEEMHVEGDSDADLIGALAAEGVTWLPS